MIGERDLLTPRMHRFISPHYDDIALSCGALVARLAANGLTPRVDLVFGQEPPVDEPLSPFATAMHEGWGLDTGEVIAARRAEDAEAVRILGAETHLLPFRDAIYRGAHYTDDNQLFGPPVEAEGGLPGMLVEALSLPEQPDQAARFYVPLAVGGHVDHRHACGAGVLLARRGWEVWFYEDLPYALKPGALERRLGELATETPMEPGPAVPAGPYWPVKIDAVLAYPSQLDTIFRQYLGVGTTREEIDSALAAYGKRIGGGAAAERFWTLAG